MPRFEPTDEQRQIVEKASGLSQSGQNVYGAFQQPCAGGQPSDPLDEAASTSRTQF
jgi:hypothetical protein